MPDIKADTLKEWHIPQLAQLEKICFRQPWSEDAFKHELDNAIACYTVLTLQDAVVAYGGFWHIIDEGHITNIAVHPAYRHQGLGRQVMQAIIANAKLCKIERLTLEVRVSNAPAIALYTSFGFLSAGVRRHYYPDGEDAYIMWMEIDYAFDGK